MFQPWKVGGKLLLVHVRPHLENDVSPLGVWTARKMAKENVRKSFRRKPGTRKKT